MTLWPSNKTPGKVTKLGRSFAQWRYGSRRKTFGSFFIRVKLLTVADTCTKFVHCPPKSCSYSIYSWDRCYQWSHASSGAICRRHQIKTRVTEWDQYQNRRMARRSKGRSCTRGSFVASIPFYPSRSLCPILSFFFFRYFSFDEVHVLDIECLFFLNRAIEGISSFGYHGL